MSEFAKWFLICFMTLGALLTITSVGKPRKPLTPTMAASVVAITAIEIVLIVAFWKNG